MLTYGVSILSISAASKIFLILSLPAFQRLNYRLGDPGFNSRQGLEISPSKKSRHQTSYSMSTRQVRSFFEYSGRGVELTTSQSIAKVKMEWSYTPTPLHTFMESTIRDLSSTSLLHTVNQSEHIITLEKTTGIRKYEQKYSKHTIACVRSCIYTYIEELLGKATQLRNKS